MAEETTKEFPPIDPESETPQERAAELPPEEKRRGGFRVLAFLGVTFALLVGMCFGLRALNVLPSFDNPFDDQEVDRSQPVLLQSMRDLSRYVAADGTFQVIVDLQQNKENIPEFLVNRRTLFVGSGSVEAYVDFSSLAEGALVVDEAKKTIKITLPPPQLSTASLDMQRSYVVAEERGIFDSIKDAFAQDPNKQQRVYQEAQKRITDAARSSGLDQRAKDNTEKMLESLFARLGYTTVTVAFDNP